METKREKVFVAMSGGVDSSVAALLLKEQGYDITGIFIKAWQPDFLKCTWRKERQDAIRVCTKLGIPFLTFDLEGEYKRDVVDYMVGEYKIGRTPNPDVMCNKTIKFGAFYRRAISEGADLIATGHHARVNEERGSYKLLTGVDENKDQSYFLWTLTQEVLSRTLFPIGGHKKPEVRKIAQQHALHTAQKKDSQGLCFLGEIDMREFLKHYIDTNEGKLLNENGDKIGAHEGAHLYTTGQRHGFTVSKKRPDDSPYYVVEKDVEENTVTVSQDFNTKKRFGLRRVLVRDLNWISGEAPDASRTYEGRIRYRQPLQSCTIAECQNPNDKYHVIFDEPQRAVSLGQSLVLYDGEACLGGGIIS